MGDSVRIDNVDGSFDVAQITDFFKARNVKHFQFDGVYYLSKQRIISEELESASKCRFEKEPITPVHPARMLYFDRSFDFDGFRVDQIQCKVKLVNPRAMNVFYCDPQYEFNGRTKPILSVGPYTESVSTTKEAMKRSTNKLHEALSRFNALRLEMSRMSGVSGHGNDRNDHIKRSRKRKFSDI